MSSRNRWINRLAKRSVVASAAAAAASSLLSTSAWATTGTWISSGSANYQNTTAWLFGNPVPNAATEIANFTGVDLSPGFVNNPNSITHLNVDLTSISVTLGQMVFSDINPATPGDWNIVSSTGGATLVLNNGSAVPVITVNNLGNLATSSFASIQVPINIGAGAAGGLVKTGAGELRLLASNNFGGGTLFVNQGTLTVGTLSQIGNVASTISLGGGTLALRNDGTFDLSNAQLNVASATGGTSGLYVDHALNSNVTGVNVIEQVGTVSLTAAGVTFQIRGSTNGYGLHIGTLNFAQGGSSVVSNLMTGSLTIDNVTSTLGGTLTFSGDDVNGSNLTITNGIQQNGTSALSVNYSDSHTLTVGSFGAPAPTGALTVSGSGTLLVTGNNAVIPSATLTVSDGTLDFSASNSLSIVGTLLMGAGGNSASYLKMGAGGLQLNNTATFSAGNSVNPSQPGIITGAAGAVFSMNPAAITQTFFINQIITSTGAPGQDLTISVPVQGSGTLLKSGVGELVMSGSNNFSGTINVNNGTLTSIARTSGSALTANASSGTVIISSGNLRIQNNTASSGFASAGSLYFTGDLKPAQLIIDASTGGGQATLNVGTLGGRLSGTGVLTIIPVSNPLNSVEHINVVGYGTAVDPANNHGILAPYIATQQSATNSSLDFVARVGVGAGSNNLVAPSYTTFTGSESGGTLVVQRTSNITVSSLASIFALKVDNGAIVDGSGLLFVGDNIRSGIILNNGAQLNESNLILSSQEAVFWSGGTTTGGTVGSAINLTNGGANNLTTGGAQPLIFSSTINFGNNSRTITVGSGTTIFSGNMIQGNLYKSGSGVLALTGDNPTFNGTLTVGQATVSVGTGGAGSLGAGSVNTGAPATGVGTLQFNLSGTRTITNFITGSGTVLQNSSTGGVLILHSTPASTYSNLAVLNGNVQLSANGDIPQTATIAVSGGSFDMNGKNQTINALAAGILVDASNTPVSTGLITNSSATLSTLTLAPASGTNASYSGSIGGTSTMRIVKAGSNSSTQVLAGNGDYTGGVQISNGTLSAAFNTALGHDASVILNNANGAVLRLEANGVTLPASLSISISNGTGTVSVGTANGGANAGTISGAIVGTGTLVINNQNNAEQLTVGPTSLDTMVDPNIAGAVGTVLLSSGGLRFNAAAGANVGNTSLNFNMAGTGVISTVAAATVRLGNVQGGGNFTISPASGSAIQLGAAGGAQIFNGTLAGATSFSKVGTGTLQLNNKTSTYTGATNVLGGALVLSNATLSGTPTINIVGGAFVMTGAASISGNTFINLSQAFPFDVVTHQGWTTPSNVTVQGTGEIDGNYQHNAGSIIVGTDGGFGTISFDALNTLTFGDNLGSAPGSAGITQLDYSSLGIIGSGFNDVITVNGNVALNADALFRVNNTNAIHNFTVGETYATILYTGSEIGSLASTVSSAFRGSFQFVDMPNDPITGDHVIGVKVVSFDTTPQVSTWQGSVSSTWDLNVTKNFLNAGATSTYFQGDSVVFDNSILTGTATSKSINLAAGLILPGTLTFGNTSNLLSYTVNGPGVIGGGARVLVNGGGTVSFTNVNNTFTGGTVVSSGWLMVSGSGNLNKTDAMGVGSILLNGGGAGSLAGQAATLVFAANANPNNDIYAGTLGGLGGIVNFVGLGSLGTGGKLHGTFNAVTDTGRWDLYSNLQLSTDLATGTILINSNREIRLMRPYAGAGLFFNFAAGQGVLDTNLFDPMNDTVYIGGLAGPGSGNLRGFNGGNAAWYKAFAIGGANADSTWGGQVTDSFGRSPAVGGTGTGGGQNLAGISNSHAPTAITKVGTASLKLTGVSIVMSGDLLVNQGTLIVDNTDPNLGTRDGGGLFQWASRVQVNSGATFQMGSGGLDGLNVFMSSDGNGTNGINNDGTFVQASATGFGVLWNANGGTINVAKGYTTTQINSSYQGNSGSVNLNTQYETTPNLTIAGSGANIYGSIKLSGGTLSPGNGGAGRYGTMTITGVDDSGMADPATLPLDNAGQSFGLEMNGGALVFDVGSTSANSDSLTIGGAGVLGQLRIDNNANNKIVVDFNGTSTSSTYTLAGFGTLASGSTLQGAAGPKLILNGRNAVGTVGVVTTGGTQKLVLSITTASSASNTQWATSNGTWDVGSWGAGATRNWTNLDNGNLPDYFYNGDNINFDTSVIGGTVTISGSVAPNLVTVKTTDGTSITFAGQGRITGNASLVKNGNGTLSIRTANDFSGGTTINAGTLELGTSPGAAYFQGMNISATGPFFDSDRQGDVGTGTVTINPGATLAYRATRGAHLTNNIVGGGNFVVDVLQGAVRLDTAGSWTGGTVVRVGYLSLGVDNAVPSTGSLFIQTIPHPTVTAGTQLGAGGRFDLNEHSQSINELYGNGIYSLVMNEGSLNILNPQTTFSVGSGNFVGAVHQGQEGGGQGSFAQIAVVKYSTGTLTMNYITTPNSNGGTLGTNVTGLTDVKQGLLVMRGIQAANGANDTTNTQTGSWTVRNGATLAGDGNIRSAVNVDPGGILSPGLQDATNHTAGTLTVNALNLNNSVLNFNLHGILSDDVDVQVNNALVAQGTSTVNLNVDSALVTQPGTYPVIDYRGSALTAAQFASKFTKGTVTNGGSVFTYTLQNNTSLDEIDFVVTQPTVTSTWNVSSGGGSWAVATNWSSVGTIQLAPNSPDSVANLTAPGTLTQDATITVDNIIGLSTLNLATANGHNFKVNQVASGSFNFNTSSNNAVGINVSSGNQTINVPTAFSRDATINVAPGSTLTLQQSLDATPHGQNVTATGGGMLAVGNIRNTAGFNGNSNLSITGNTTMKISHFTSGNVVNGASKVNTISIASGSVLDITNNALVLDYANPGDGTTLLSSTRALIVGGGTIGSARIISTEPDPTGTHGIGYRDNQGNPLSVKDPAQSSRAYRSLGAVTDQGGAGGVSADVTSIVVKYTYKGDTNLDGAVDISDLLNVATHYNQTSGASVPGVGGNGWVWQQGDFNNDGNVDINDLKYVGQNWLQGTGSNPGTQLAPLLTALGLPSVPTGGPEVPEPATLGVIGIGLTGLMARRRRRRS